MRATRTWARSTSDRPLGRAQRVWRGRTRRPGDLADDSRDGADVGYIDGELEAAGPQKTIESERQVLLTRLLLAWTVVGLVVVARRFS